jgi:hypothetical protein
VELATTNSNQTGWFTAKTDRGWRAKWVAVRPLAPEGGAGGLVGEGGGGVLVGTITGGGGGGGVLVGGTAVGSGVDVAVAVAGSGVSVGGGVSVGTSVKAGGGNGVGAVADGETGGVAVGDETAAAGSPEPSPARSCTMSTNTLPRSKIRITDSRTMTVRMVLVTGSLPLLAAAESQRASLFDNLDNIL